MDNIILYLLNIIQEQYQQICWLILFICRYIPLKQWAHDELHSPKYQKFLTDKLPKFKEFPGKALKFIADGYSAYPLAAQLFKLEKNWDVFITQVIGLTNDDEVSKEFRPFKQLIERLNRTFKESYRITCGYGMYLMIL